MKRMNEVFELPVIGSELEWRLSETTMYEDSAIAHAINNVDALADALEGLLSASGTYANIKADAAARMALAAYRGTK